MSCSHSTCLWAALVAIVLSTSAIGCGGGTNAEPIQPETIESNEPPPNPRDEPLLPEDGP
jgi:hypothetical protein